jgi:hypothetical protein
LLLDSHKSPGGIGPSALEMLPSHTTGKFLLAGDPRRRVSDLQSALKVVILCHGFSLSATTVLTPDKADRSNGINGK